MTDGSHFARECLIAFTPWHLDAVSGSHPPHLLRVKRSSPALRPLARYGLRSGIIQPSSSIGCVLPPEETVRGSGWLPCFSARSLKQPHAFIAKPHAAKSQTERR